MHEPSSFEDNIGRTHVGRAGGSFPHRRVRPDYVNEQGIVFFTWLWSPEHGAGEKGTLTIAQFQSEFAPQPQRQTEVCHTATH